VATPILIIGHLDIKLGTIAIEFINQFRERGIEVDVVLVCCSGGGLASGILEVCAEAAPGAVVHTVEPEGFDDMRRSLELGYRVANEKATGSICDALLTTMPGVLTFAALNEGKSKNIAGEGLVVTDEEVKHAMRVAFQQFKIVLEPGGAAALAAALYNKVDLKGKNVVVVASGGNVDASLFAEIINNRA
jgi:threonine dehydratase